MTRIEHALSAKRDTILTVLCKSCYHVKAVRLDRVVGDACHASKVKPLAWIGFGSSARTIPDVSATAVAATSEQGLSCLFVIAGALY